MGRLNANSLATLDGDVVLELTQIAKKSDITNTDVASEQDAKTGTNNSKVMTPLRTKQSIRSTPASGTELGGVKVRLDGDVLYIRTDATDA